VASGGIRFGLANPCDLRYGPCAHSAPQAIGHAVTRLIVPLLSLLLGSGASLAETREHALVPEGADFCFSRTYDAAHLARHKRQVVSSLRIMGRNAWLSSPGLHASLYASAVVTFRDRKRPLELYGRCVERDRKPGLLRCSFVPGAFQDVLVQVIELEGAGESVKASPSADWLVVRAGKEPDGPYGRPATDDAVFHLERRKLAACSPPARLWSPKGATPELIGKLP